MDHQFGTLEDATARAPPKIAPEVVRPFTTARTQRAAKKAATTRGYPYRFLTLILEDQAPGRMRQTGKNWVNFSGRCCDFGRGCEIESLDHTKLVPLCFGTIVLRGCRLRRKFFAGKPA